jgi:hypothetical protein
MPSSELIQWLSQVIGMTESGTIKWKSANPTTFIWETQSAQVPARVVLQRLERMESYLMAGRATQRKVSYFILQAFQAPNPRSPAQQIPIITMSGADDPEVNTPLEKLYGLVAVVAEREHIEFLKSLLPSN